jgi:hypothetical protein
LLISGFFIELFLNQQVRITAGHGTRFRDDVLFWHKTEVARAGTAMAAEKFVELQHELERTLPESLEKLANLRSGEGQ